MWSRSSLSLSPGIHHGLCIVAANPNRDALECDRFCEFFMERIPYEWILEVNKDNDFEAVKEHTRDQIAKMSLDIMQNSTVDLSREKLT